MNVSQFRNVRSWVLQQSVVYSPPTPQRQAVETLESINQYNERVYRFQLGIQETPGAQILEIKTTRKMMSRTLWVHFTDIIWVEDGPETFSPFMLNNYPELPIQGPPNPNPSQ